jgi:hypothetical protein
MSIDREVRDSVKSYLPCALTAEYKDASREFIKYVDVYLERAGSIELLAKSEDRIPVFATFPHAFVTALPREIEARNKQTSGHFRSYRVSSKKIRLKKEPLPNKPSKGVRRATWPPRPWQSPSGATQAQHKDESVFDFK